MGFGRYLVLGFLDSAITTLALAPLAGEPGGLSRMLALASVVTLINLLTGFMAEYTEERSRLRRVERSLFLRRGFMLRTILHRQAVESALSRGLIFGAASMGSALFVQSTLGLIVIRWVPVVPMLALGIFGYLVSRYFGGNGLVWFLICIMAGLAAAYVGRSVGPLIR